MLYGITHVWNLKHNKLVNITTRRPQIQRNILVVINGDREVERSNIEVGD